MFKRDDFWTWSCYERKSVSVSQARRCTNTDCAMVQLMRALRSQVLIKVCHLVHIEIMVSADVCRICGDDLVTWTSGVFGWHGGGDW